MAIPSSERFIAKVDFKGQAECWLWRGTTAGTNARYGYFRPGTRSTDPKVPAHRFAYELWIGSIPEGMEIDHVAAKGCTSKLCVNPFHLEAVTHRENRKRGRLALCRKGLHDLSDPANQRWDSDGNRRGCSQCHREAAKRRAESR